MPNNELEKRLWTAADQLRANSGLKASEYSVPVLGLIFLRYADEKFEEVKKRIQNKRSSRRRRGLSKEDYQAEGAVYLPDNARFSYLLNLPEDEDIGKKINDAMKAVEDENEELRDVLPVNYQEIDNTTLASLLKILSDIPGIEGDAFGKIYEYFLGGFARSEGARGGEFFTPTSLVKLIVEIIEPYSGRIYDPASGSGGMFVQSARFVERHRKNPGSEISIFGQEKTAASVRLCKLNLAVHGLGGDIRQGNSYYDDPFNSIEKFDFVMANPPFNVNGVDKEKIKSDKRFRYGIPRTDNANYLWIQLFYTALNENGRAGFVMANSASDARQSEQEIRQRLIEDRAVDVMISISSNFFYTVTLPCTLWFFDKGKKKTKRKDKVLFIDARNIYTQVDRALREFTTSR
jgi:type I restriction enzyme M protein